MTIDPVEFAEREVATRQRGVEDCADAARVTDALFMQEDSTINIEAASKARLRLERSRALLVTAESALTDARERKRLADLEVLREQHEADRHLLEWFPQSLNLLVAALVDLDQRADETLLQVCRSVVAGQDAHDAAVAVASQIGERIDNPRPSLADVKLMVRRELTKVRAEENREDVSDLFANVDDDWRTSGLSAAELATHRENEAEAHANKLREEGARAVIAAVSAAAKRMPDPISNEVTQ